MLGFKERDSSRKGTSSIFDPVEFLELDTPKKPFIVSVEGNIGCGKSTLLDYFNCSNIVETLKEPLDKWTNIHGQNALGLLYQDAKRWSFSFNTYVQLTRLQMHQAETYKPVKLLERSLYSTRYCFVEHEIISGTLQTMEHTVLTGWFDWLLANQGIHIDLFVYLQADPDVCYARLQKRNRKEEAGVPKSYLESLHQLHEDWLIHGKFPLPAPVLVLDANSDLPQMTKLYEEHKSTILCGCSEQAS